MKEIESVLVINAGSSSLKGLLFALKNGDLIEKFKIAAAQLQEPVASLKITSVGDGKNQLELDLKIAADEIEKSKNSAHSFVLFQVLDWLSKNAPNYKIVTVGHRVVHGATKYSQPTRVNDKVFEELKAYIPLAPLHQPYNLKLIEICKNHLPDILQVACFDTAFHTTTPDIAAEYALPKHLTEEGIKRYSFHGSSYEFIRSSLQKIAPEIASKKVIIAHLGAGSSMAAMENGKAQASTMGFTAVDGLPMGSRTGTIDPGVLLYLMQEKNMNAKQIETLIYKQSGWLGVSGGISADMLTLRNSNSSDAKKAIDMFVYRIARETGSLTAALQGLDAFVFTGGVGENDVELREQVGKLLGWLGVEICPNRNARKDILISRDSSKVKVFRIPTNEEKMIAEHSLEVYKNL